MKRWKLLQKLIYTNRSRLTLNTRTWSNMNYIQLWKLWNQFFANFSFWCWLKSSENRKGSWNHKIRRLAGVCIRYWKVRLAGIFYINCRFAIFQTTKQLIQYTVLEIQFRSLKYTAVIRLRKNLETFNSYPIDNKVKTVCWCKQPTSNSFQTPQTVYTYSNCTIDQLLHCWKMF